MQNSAATKESYMKNLTGYAYPAVEPVEDPPGRFIRRWILRVINGPADDDTLAAAVGRLERAARAATVEAYGEGASAAENMASARGTLVDEKHIVLEIVCPDPGKAVGDSAAIVTWSVLRGADRLWGIEDLEGIPKKYWFALR